MVKLSHENFIKARDYILANGDDINRAWFRYLFEGNDTNEFLNGLVFRRLRGLAEIAGQVRNLPHPCHVRKIGQI